MSKPARSNSSKQLRDGLKNLAVTVDVSSTVPIDSYYNVAKDLEKTAFTEWERHKNFEQAYVHLMKLSILVVEKIPTHSAYNLKQNEPNRLWAKRVFRDTIEQLERIATELDRIQDENISKIRDLELIDEFDSTPEEFQTFSPKSDAQAYENPLVGLDNNNTGIPTKVVSDDKPERENEPIVPQTSEKSTQNLKELFDKLRVPGSPPPTSSLPIAASISASIPNTMPPKPELAPLPKHSLASTILPFQSPVDQPTAISSSVPIVRTNSELQEPLPRQEIEILNVLGNVQKFPLPTPRSSIFALKLFCGSTIAMHSFTQEDYHVSFQIFMNHIPPNLQITPSAVETNRCFFNHLGAAIRVHPFALQTAFRIRTRQLMKRSTTEDIAKELLVTVTQPADLVDANTLIYLWPQEFRNLRIAILSGTPAKPILSVFQPEKAPENGKVYEVFLRCSNFHFTYLIPHVTPQISEVMKEKNISFLTLFMEDLKRSGNNVFEYPVQTPTWSLFNILNKAKLQTSYC